MSDAKEKTPEKSETNFRPGENKARRKERKKIKKKSIIKPSIVIQPN